MTDETEETLSEQDQSFLDQLSEADQEKVAEILERREKNQLLVDEIYELGASLPPTFFLALRLEALLEFLPPSTRVAYDLLVEQEANIALSHAVVTAREMSEARAGSGLILPA